MGKKMVAASSRTKNESTRLVIETRDTVVLALSAILFTAFHYHFESIWRTKIVLFLVSIFAHLCFLDIDIVLAISLSVLASVGHENLTGCSD